MYEGGRKDIKASRFKDFADALEFLENAITGESTIDNSSEVTLEKSESFSNSSDSQKSKIDFELESIIVCDTAPLNAYINKSVSMPHFNDGHDLSDNFSDYVRFCKENKYGYVSEK